MASALHASHPRSYRDNRFVYPVWSRRSQGLSLGINLNPDKVCNFDCIYCQVDRRSESETEFVEMPRLLAELDDAFDLAAGPLYADEPFSRVPAGLRRLNDVAFSGDGEPTTYRNFDEIVEAVASSKRRRGLDGVKMVLITNASMLHRPAVVRGLEILDRNRGEIWAKLEAGTEDYYKRVERTVIPFRQILDNITRTALVRPVVIQALFMRIHGEPPPRAELEAFCDRLNEITAAGGRISLVQVYTVARPPAESYVTSLSDGEVDAVADLVHTRTQLRAEPYYGSA